MIFFVNQNGLQMEKSIILVDFKFQKYRFKLSKIINPIG